jgi:hypothetical protein
MLKFLWFLRPLKWQLLDGFDFLNILSFHLAVAGSYAILALQCNITDMLHTIRQINHNNIHKQPAFPPPFLATADGKHTTQHKIINQIFILFLLVYHTFISLKQAQQCCYAYLLPHAPVQQAAHSQQTRNAPSLHPRTPPTMMNYESLNTTQTLQQHHSLH